ncbi:hypothetical protein Pst134EA_023082 [Puccinia striiformis f. sp. tritici]|uniref:hypothetical protein n=1 Tax=Puccinia striiformis f. sp. tritici TaxID=168172 RepID=UPI0020072834|nr:hypothetical protein Pst134EA_023082 [Puccinia striiformis f. sp. tritici]KAH9455622.1 hypothetical protein Pst134EA_023082 [Puccinia striiformis f. sp. tritici]
MSAQPTKPKNSQMVLLSNYAGKSSHKSRATGLHNSQDEGRRLAPCERQPTGHGNRMRQGDDAAMGRSTCFKEDHYHARETNTSTTLEISTRSEQSTTNLTGCPHQAVSVVNTSTDKIIEGTTRYILTNTGSLTTPQLYSALQHTLRHHPPTLQRIVKVLPVLQPNRRPRFDIWIKNEVAAGLQKSLNLDFKGRQQLADYIFESKLPWHQCLIL